jgi:hypothetical protein
MMKLKLTAAFASCDRARRLRCVRAAHAQKII